MHLVNEKREVVGGIDRITKKWFLFTVDKRNANTLNDVIEINVLPNTHIMTDMWRGYRSKDSTANTRSMVNNSKNFVNQIDKNIHTQNLLMQITSLNLWMWLNLILK